MGIVGLGGTGRELAARALGIRNARDRRRPHGRGPRPKASSTAARWTVFDDLLADSDVVAVCAPLTPETEGMFDRGAFSRMQPHAVLINVTRGPIVDEEALVEALETGAIGGAGLDVVPQEPMPDDHPLWRFDNVVITPHSAGGSPHRMDRSVDLFCENLTRLLARPTPHQRNRQDQGLLSPLVPTSCPVIELRPRRGGFQTRPSPLHNCGLPPSHPTMSSRASGEGPGEGSLKPCQEKAASTRPCLP